MFSVMEHDIENKGKVLSILKNYGEDTLSYFHLQDERKYFFSPSGKSFLSYKILNKVAVVASDPVGEPSEIALLLKSFLEYTAIWKLNPCFIGVSNTYISTLKINGLRTAKIGEEAILILDTFERNKLKKKVKWAVRHLEESGVEIFFFSPRDLPPFIQLQIEKISQEWIEKKGGREKGFSMTLKRLPTHFDNDCRIVIAIKESVVLGFLCFAPAYQSATVSLDQARRKNDSPNGLNEFLIIKSAEYFKKQRIKKISLNFATFSNITEQDAFRLAVKTNIFKVLAKMYKSHALRAFNEKFLPSWENRYIAYSTIKHLPLFLLAILRAER